MSNDVRTLELFAEANPVPSELAMEASDIEPAAYLATLQTRSSEVTQLDQRRTQQDKKANGWLLGLAAAALLLVIGVVAIVLNQGTEETPPAGTTPAPPTTVAATTVPDSEANGSSDDASGWEALPVFRFGLEETARIATFEPSFAAQVPRGWSADITEFNGLMSFDQEPSDDSNPSLGIDVIRLDDLNSAAVTALLADTVRFSSSEPIDFEAGGATGVTIVFTPLAEEALTDFGDGTNIGTFRLPEGEEQAIYVLDVGGRSIAFLAHTSNGLPEVETLESILDTIIWRDLQN